MAILTVSIYLILLLPVALAANGCEFEHKGCTYNIYLSPKDGEVKDSEVRDSEVRDSDVNCGTRSQQVFLDRAQNDYTAKIDDIEKNFSFLRDEHEQRIKELESTVREFLGLDKNGDRSKEEKDGVVSKGTSSLGNLAMNNADLMDRLEDEFNKLRREIREKSEDLMDTKIKLNETSTKMHEMQLTHFQTSQDLLNAENQITMLLRERSVLKNQLKDRSYKLDVSMSKATECEVKTTDQQDQMMKLFRSESTLKEELMMVQMQLNQSRTTQVALEEKYDALKIKHERTRYILKVREKDLIDCYEAKTSTFCGFEDPKMCGFSNINDTSDFFDWERARGSTPSAKTGPSKDHTCDGVNGHFMFIEASSKGRGNNAILYSPLYRGMVEQCVEFFYHMYGRHVGTLNVYAQARGDVLRSVWRAYGNQGDVWSNARLAIPQDLAMAGYQIAFEGITENGYLGDIAIDDVSVTDGPCPVDQKIIPVKVAINATNLVVEGKSLLNFTTAPPTTETSTRKLRKKPRHRKKE